MGRLAFYMEDLMLDALLPKLSRKFLRNDRHRLNMLDSLFWQMPQLTYMRLRDHGFQPASILDIGANNGDWSRMARTVFPGTPILMIEAREEMRESLAAACLSMPDTNFVIALVGSDNRDSVTFHSAGTGSSIFRECSDVPQSTISLPMVTLESVTASHKLKRPIFVKLDLQGAEIDVLRGAKTTMEAAEVIQIELALMQYNAGAPTAADAISFMNDRGFVLYDISGFVRPNGVDLVQIDALFTKKESSLRKDYFAFD